MEIENRNAKHMSSMIESIAISEFVSMDLTEKMSLMANIGRVIVRMDTDPLIAAAIVFDNEAVFPLAKFWGDRQKEAAKSAIIDLASSFNASCLVVVAEAWYVDPKRNDPYAHLSPPLHPAREECLMVAGRDHFQNLSGIQKFTRSGDQIVFGELMIYTAGCSWLNEWEPHLRTATEC